VDPTVNDNHGIRVVCEHGYTKVLKILLYDKRIDPGSQNNYAIRHAQFNGHQVCVKYLKEDPRVDPSVLSTDQNENYRHLDVTRKTQLNRSDVCTTPEVFIKGCTTTEHTWHVCRSNHRPIGNHVTFPAACKSCKQTLLFMAHLCVTCGLQLQQTNTTSHINP